MPRRLFGLAIAVAAVAIIVFTFSAYFGSGNRGFVGGGGGGPAMLAGAPAQNFDVKRLDGHLDGVGHHRGHVVFVNLWATWCAPCRTETPALERLYKEEGPRGLVILGVDQGESRAVAAAFAKELDLTYPILLDEKEEYGNAYESVGLPTSLIIDRNGHIVRGIDGILTFAQMKAAVLAALDQPSR